MASNNPATSIRDWLDSLDLGHFTDLFLANGFTELHHVCNITEDKLSLLGITQRGYQKRILNHLPSEAEAFLSEFISGSENSQPLSDVRGGTPVAEPPPPMPLPRSTVKQYGKENGHLMEKKPSFDDEKYVLHGQLRTVDPTVDIPVLPPKRSLPDGECKMDTQQFSKCQGFKKSPDSEPAPPPPPRSSSNRVTVASDTPSQQLRDRPMPQPRARSDPNMAARPPPLPGRDEKPQRPAPRPRPTPQVPPRVGHTQAASASPASEHFKAPFVVLNDYTPDPLPCGPLPAPPVSHPHPPPVIPPNAISQLPKDLSTDDHLPNLPPPPPPKSFAASSQAPQPVNRNLPPVPNQDHRSPPDLPYQTSLNSQTKSIVDAFSVDSSTPQRSEDGPSQPSFPSQPSVLPYYQVSPMENSEEGSAPAYPHPSLPMPSVIPVIPPRPAPSLPGPPGSNVTLSILPPNETSAQVHPTVPAVGSEEGNLPVLPHPPPTIVSPVPIVPPRPSPSLPDSSGSDLPPPILPPKQTSTSRLSQASAVDGIEEVSLPILPPPPVSSMPVVPPRPVPDPSGSDLASPFPPSQETSVHLHRIPPANGSEELALPVLPPPSPPPTAPVPVIPPRPSSLVSDPVASSMPPPLPPSSREKSVQHDSPQSFKSDMLNPSDSANETSQGVALPSTDGFDPFEFDPFATPDATMGFYSADPVLRPPSLFCNPEDNLESFVPPSSLPLPPPLSEVLPSQSALPALSPASRAVPTPSKDASSLSMELMSRPVPLPPGVSPQDQPRTPALPVRSSVGTVPITASISETATRLDSAVSNPPVPTILPRKTSNLIDLSSHDSDIIQFKTVADGNKGKTLLDLDIIEEPPRSTPSPPPPALERHDTEDQYSVVQRAPRNTQQMKIGPEGPSDAPKIPARPPPIPPRLDPQGEAVPTFEPPERPSPIGCTHPDDEYHLLGQAKSGPVSWSSLHVPVSPSALSDGSDRHSYILLSESVSGSPDTAKAEKQPDEPSPMPDVPQTLSDLDKTIKGDSSMVEDATSVPKPARRAPPPPVRQSEVSSVSVPKLPARPFPPKREVTPPLPPIRKEEEYDLLDPKAVCFVSPLRDEPLDSPVRIAFKELAQSEESGDDDDSGFDMDSLDYGSQASKQESGVHIDIDLDDRRSKIDLSHVLRMNQAWHPTAPHRPLARTHSRAIDENTRKRLSKKLSQSLQEGNSTAEVPANKMTVLKKKGYLWKQGGKQNNKGFRKRWMDFDGNEMRYYENEKTLSECKGIIPVGTMRDVKNLSGTPKAGFGDTKQYRITLETTGRSFYFAAETLDEGTLWANVLMQAIISYKPPPGGFPVGGDMSCPDKKGYVKIEGYHQKRFLAVKGEKLCIYNTEMDFESAIAISDIQMKLASVKELSKSKIQLATPGKIYMLTVESPQDLKEWMTAMREAIQEGLSDHSILEQIQQNSSNKYCADCRMKDPDWASINLGISICKNCSGTHRNLGVHLSKVRSLKMDTKVWTPALVQLMLVLGNKKSNAFWEANLDENEKAVPDDSSERRQLYIFKKYKERKYCQSRLSTDKNMDKTLVKAASLGNLDECMQLVFSGANVSYSREDGKSAYDVAKASKFPVVAEFLNQNVGIQISPLGSNAASKAAPKVEKKLILQPTAHESKQEFIRRTGYLYKMVNIKKGEFLRQYCTLEHGIFSYCEDKNQPVKSTIEGIDMVLIAVAEPRQGQKYCFEIYTSVGRTYLFSAETEEERKVWMVDLAKIHSLECMWDSLEDFEQAGFLHKKEGAAATNWQRLWFILKGKSLLSFSSATDELDEIDLRKLINLSPQDAESTIATDYSHTLSIILPGKNIYLRAETKQAADCWYEAINKVTSQGGQALEDQLLTGDNVPIIVSQCINFVATHDGITTEGIYRLSGTSSVIRKIVSSFIEDPRTARLKEEYTVHDVTGALKKFFRELPDPLLTSKLYKKWTEVASYQDHSVRLQWYQHLLGELPSVNYNTLKMLIGHLKNVADNSNFNKMYIRNLAAVFGPTLMASHDSSFVHAEYEIAVIADLLTYYAWLYGVTDEEMRKEREKELKYQEGLSKIRAAQASENSAEQVILMEIFMGRKEQGNSINIKISMDHTATEILKLALEQQKKKDDGTMAMFEVIRKGELERLIHGYERVLPQVLSWNQQMAAGNYICIKRNKLMEDIEPFMEQASLSDMVRYSESKKNFKKYSFELMNNVITCYKEKNTTPANSWKVADMKIYVGVEKKRSPPTQWGISFTINNEEGMRAICLENEASYQFWLAGLLKSKVVDPSSLTYSPHALSFRSEHESSFARYSRNLPRELSNVASKMSFWRKSRNSVDES